MKKAIVNINNNIIGKIRKNNNKQKIPIKKNPMIPKLK